MSKNCLSAVLCSMFFIILLSGATAASAQQGPDWSNAAPVTVTTTDGPVTEVFVLQAARVGDQVYFRVQFNYTGAKSAGAVFFAIELARDINVTTPMSQGDEMMIVSQKGPNGKSPSTYDYYLSATESEPDPIVPGSVTVQNLSITGSHYEIVFSRPMATNDTTQQVQLETGRPVLLAFAVSEWGLESAHAYTWFTYQMNITESQVAVTPYERQSGAGQVIIREVMMIDPTQAVIEALSIFTVLFVSILYLGTRGVPKRA